MRSYYFKDVYYIKAKDLTVFTVSTDTPPLEEEIIDLYGEGMLEGRLFQVAGLEKYNKFVDKDTDQYGIAVRGNVRP